MGDRAPSERRSAPLQFVSFRHRIASQAIHHTLIFEFLTPSNPVEEERHQEHTRQKYPEGDPWCRGSGLDISSSLAAN